MREIALFIDYDNAQLKAEELDFIHCQSSSIWPGVLLREVERACDGTVVMRRAYGDALLKCRQVFPEAIWHSETIRDMIAEDVYAQRQLADNGFQMIHCPTVTGDGAKRKNRADIFLSLDCLEIATKYANIEVIALLSQDSDISALCQRLRALGRKVALITLSRTPPRILRSLATYIVNYDQAAIDRYGHDLITQSIATLASNERQPLVAGVSVSALRAQLVTIDPQFSQETVGFDKFSDLVDCCIEDVVRKGDKLYLRDVPSRVAPRASIATSPVAVSTVTVAATRSQSPPVPPPPVEVSPLPRVQNSAVQGQVIVDVPTIVDRRKEFLAGLAKTSMRPLPGLRRRIGSWLRTTQFSEEGEPLQPINWRTLVIAVETEFCSTESKSRVRDALKVLSLSGILELGSTDIPLAERLVLKYHSESDSQSLIVAMFVTRLASAGIAVLPSDDRDLCQMAFDETSDTLLDATRRGIAYAQTTDTEETNREQSSVDVPSRRSSIPAAKSSEDRPS